MKPTTPPTDIRHATAPTPQGSTMQPKRAANPIVRAIARGVIGVLVFNALSPLSVIAQDKGTVNPAAQRQLQQLSALNQRIEAAKLENSRSPADRVSEDLKQAQDLVRGLSSDSAARNPKPKPSGSDSPSSAPQLRAIGPNMRIEVQGSAIRLPDDRRAEHQARLESHLKSIRNGQSSVRQEFEATGKDLRAKKLPAEIEARHHEAVSPVRTTLSRVRPPEPSVAARPERQQPRRARRLLQAPPRAKTSRAVRPEEAAVEHTKTHDAPTRNDQDRVVPATLRQVNRFGLRKPATSARSTSRFRPSRGKAQAKPILPPPRMPRSPT